MTVTEIQDILAEELTIACSDGHRAAGPVRQARILAYSTELHQLAFEGRAATVRKRSRIWDEKTSYGRSDFNELPDKTPQRLFKTGSYAGKGLRVF